MVANIARIAKGVGRLVFDPKFTEVATNTLKVSKKANGFTGFHKQVKNAFLEAEKQTKGTKFWSNLWKSIQDFPKNIGNTWKNTSGAWNKTKGIAGEFGKILPAIFGAITVGFELRNIIPAFQDKGLVGGLLETAKSTGKVACSFAGFAIGQALIPIPFVGGLIGAIATDMVTSAIVGHGYADQKAEIEAQKKAEEQQYQDTLKQMQQYQQQTGNPFANTNQTAYAGNQGFVMPKMTMTPQQLMQMGQMLYSNGMTTNPMDQDFMAMTSGMNRLNYIG